MKKFAIVAAVIALGAAGCGGPNKNEQYANAVNAAQNKWGGEIANAASATPTDATFHAQAEALAGLVKDLRAIKDIPGPIKAPHQNLIAALEVAARDTETHSINLTFDLKKVQIAITQINGSF